MSRLLDIKIEIPDTVSQERASLAESKAREAALLALWEEGELTIRQAAAGLGLRYDEFLELLSERGIPIEQGHLDI
jgi:predicted HTH domain antitoxin